MKLLTFLGVSKYEETTYTWQDKEYKCRFAPLASCHFLQPEELIVFLTEDAQQQIFPEFRAEVPKSVRLRAVPVPLGKDEAELWQIFEQVSGAVQPGEEAAFDITHGLRSFPLVGLLAAAFLRSGLDVKLRAVLYGAYDVGKVVSPGHTPMFDLSPMLSLLEWAAAADRFNRTGDSRYLASLVMDQRKNLALAALKNAKLLEEVGYLGNLAGALTDISESLELIRPFQTIQSVAWLPETIRKARPALARTAQARPFAMVLEEVARAYQPLAQDQPESADTIQATLEKERTLISWYASRQHWVPAVSLAREWLLSWIMYKLGMIDLTQHEGRLRIENVVGAEANDFRTSKKAKADFHTIFLTPIPTLDAVLELWLELADVRNDIDHAGMREMPGKPKDLIKRINKCIKAIDQLPI